MHVEWEMAQKRMVIFKDYFWVNPLCYFLFSPDFLKQTTYEVEAFLEAIQFFRQERGHYGTWEMITGNEKEVKEYIPDGVLALAIAALRIVKIVNSLCKKGMLKKKIL